jgi:hypothetical protein
MAAALGGHAVRPGKRRVAQVLRTWGIDFAAAAFHSEMSGETVMLHRYFLLTVCSLMCGLVACDPVPQADTNRMRQGQPPIVRAERPPLPPDAPVLFVLHRTNGNTMQPGFTGIEYAVWADGLVLFAEPTDSATPEYRTGRIQVSEVDALLGRIEAAGFFSIAETCYLVPDGKQIVIAARSGDKRNLFMWDEILDPNYGANTHPSAAYETFKRMWRDVRTAVTNARPKEAGPAFGQTGGQDSVRGYNRKEPWKTAWLDLKLWLDR